MLVGSAAEDIFCKQSVRTVSAPAVDSTSEGILHVMRKFTLTVCYGIVTFGKLFIQDDDDTTAMKLWLVDDG